MPWPTWNSPVQSSPSRPSASSRSSITTDLPAGRAQLERDGAADAAASDDEYFHARQRSSVVARCRHPRSALPRSAPSMSSCRSSSSTRCGNATISTSQGAWRRTKSTVGEKKRDCRRQRGEEPRTIRSAPRRGAWSTIARPIARARIVVPTHLDAELGAERARLGERLGGARLGRRPSSASSARSSGTRTTWSASTTAPCSAASLTAVATISSPITPSFIGTRIRRKRGTSSKRTRRRARSTRSVRPSPCERRTATKTTSPTSEPDRARVARARVRHDRDRPRPRRSGPRRRSPAAGSRRRGS